MADPTKEPRPDDVMFHGVRMPRAVWDLCLQEARSTGLTRAEWLRRIIRAELMKQGHKVPRM